MLEEYRAAAKASGDEINVYIENRRGFA